MSTRRVLVTGASGSIGQHVVADLIARGDEVLALVHANPVPVVSRSSKKWPGRLRILSGDIGDQATVCAAVSEIDAVCHLAAYIPPDFKDPAFAERCLSVNSLATLRLALAAAERGQRFVSCSSAQAYSYSPTPLSEDAPLYPTDRATYYLASKLTGELYIEHLRQSAGLQAITFRVGSAYGVGMPERSAVGFFMRRALARRTIPVHDGGITSYDFVYVRDVSRLIVAALEGGECGLYNAGSGVATSVLQLAQAVKNTFPECPIEITMAPLGPTVPASFPALAMTKAIAAWGHEPTPLATGLREFRHQLEQQENAGRCL